MHRQLDEEQIRIQESKTSIVDLITHFFNRSSEEEFKNQVNNPTKPNTQTAEYPNYLPAEGTVTSFVGMRWGKAHKGLDIAAPLGTPIYAAADGKVLAAGDAKDNYGKKVKLQHGTQYISLYGHMSEVNVQVGDQVKKGQKIGEVGSTGDSTGNHLHFEIYSKKLLVFSYDDPRQYIPELKAITKLYVVVKRGVLDPNKAVAKNP